MFLTFDTFILQILKYLWRTLQRNAIRNTAMALTAVSVPSNTVQFGEDGRLYAEVTCVLSANEIWCRQNSTEETVSIILLYFLGFILSCVVVTLGITFRKNHNCYPQVCLVSNIKIRT